MGGERRIPTISMNHLLRISVVCACCLVGYCSPATVQEHQELYYDTKSKLRVDCTKATVRLAFVDDLNVHHQVLPIANAAWAFVGNFGRIGKTKVWSATMAVQTQDGKGSAYHVLFTDGALRVIPLPSAVPSAGKWTSMQTTIAVENSEGGFVLSESNRVSVFELMKDGDVLRGNRPKTAGYVISAIYLQKVVHVTTVTKRDVRILQVQTRGGLVQADPKGRLIY